MQIIKNFKKDNLKTLLKRDQKDKEGLREQVTKIIKNVQKNKDQALKDYTKAFDQVEIENIKILPEEIIEAQDKVSEDLKRVYKRAAQNISDYHKKLLNESFVYEPKDGIVLGQKVTPINRVGVYVPGGKAAYPSTVLMDVIPAKVAGVKEIVMVTPPDKNGKINPNILVAADIAGVNEIYKIGGAQAIAALAYGTESIKPVDKIVGPGNAYVAEAKREVFGDVSIDMVAGPSEVLIIADETANPTYIAADLLAQAEHDEMAMPILVTTDSNLAEKVLNEINKQLENDISRKEIARTSINDQGKIFLVENLEEAGELSNLIAPEHCEILVKEARPMLKHLKNAGAIFLGPYTPEALGDYFAGPNHTLPTSGSAKFFSPLGTYDFLKRSSIIEYDKEALREVASDIMKFADSEGLDAHRESINKRVKNDFKG